MVPHDDKARGQILEDLKRMTPDQIFEIAKRANIYDKQGELTEPYRPEEKPGKHPRPLAHRYEKWEPEEDGWVCIIGPFTFALTRYFQRSMSGDHYTDDWQGRLIFGQRSGTVLSVCGWAPLDKVVKQLRGQLGDVQARLNAALPSGNDE